MQCLPGSLFRKYQGKMSMPEEDEILGALQASALHGDHSVIIARKLIAIALVVARPPGNDPKFHAWNTALLKKRFSARKKLFDRFFAVKRPEPGVMIKTFRQLAAMVGGSDHHEASF